MDESNKLSSNLLSLLHNWETEPSSFLQKVIEKTGGLTLSIETRVSDMSHIVYAHFIESEPNCSEDVTINRINISKKLYYRFLDLLIAKELSEKPISDCKALMNKDIFHKVLFGCSVELVNFSYNSQLCFPWILEALHIYAYHFCKIIEVIVRADECLSREMIKHLNAIEVIILERLAWECESPIWKSIGDSKLPVPKCDDVLPDPIVFDTKKETDSESTSKLLNNSSIHSLLPSLSEKFMSPVPLHVIRNLNNALDDCSNSNPSTSTATEPKVYQKSDVSINIESSKCSTNSIDKEKSLRQGSLALFFRKFYLLSSERLRVLCDLLDITDASVRQKIWTLFQLIISRHLNLLVDRHLDQLIMCSIYSMSKLLEKDITFSLVINCYRMQPQANSSVYRNVILGPEKQIYDLATGNLKKQIHDKGDLINFYNTIFLPTVSQMLLGFRHRTDSNLRTALSPLIGSVMGNQESPRRRVSDNHSLFVRCLRAGTSPIAPSPQTNKNKVCFLLSPIKPLQEVDSTEKIRVVPLGKRMLEEHSENVKGVSGTQRVKDLISERRYWAPLKVRKQE